MGWFRRFVIRQGMRGQKIGLQRIRFADKCSKEWEAKGHTQLAAKYAVKRNILTRRWLESAKHIDELIASELCQQ